jgi:hypothetical protein
MKEDAMKNPILRILIRAILFSLISGIVVCIAGLILGWKTSAQFSDGFCMAGGVMVAIGFLNVYGMMNQDGRAGRQYSPMNNLDEDEGFRLWEADSFRGYNLLAFLGTSGLLLFGMAGLALLVE